MAHLTIKCGCGNTIEIEYDGSNPMSGDVEEVQVKCNKCGEIYSFQKPKGKIHKVLSGGTTV